MNDMVRHYFQQLSEKLHQVASEPVRLMEVCGTHTMAIGKAGIRQVIPPQVNLVSGPGCPVCVTADGEIDAFMALAALEGVVLATYGDMMRVPGTSGSLSDLKTLGADIRVVYSPLEALHLARCQTNKEIVFLGVGFETTAPASAHAVLCAREENIRNFTVFNLHKTVPPALDALMADSSMRIDGFILPGHVSAIIGEKAYTFISEKHAIPGVIAGFEATEIIAAILKLVQQIQHEIHGITNQYRNVVSYQGNVTAQQLLSETFSVCDAQWRGLGNIPGSGLKFRDEFMEFDASFKFGIVPKMMGSRKGCRCGDILKGLIKADECPLFGNVCKPETPVGPCMVSSEGTCAAYFLYEGESNGR